MRHRDKVGAGLVQRLVDVRGGIAAIVLNDGFDWLSGAIGPRPS